jgi:hypothetical protein
MIMLIAFAAAMTHNLTSPFNGIALNLRHGFVCAYFLEQQTR